MTTLKNCTYTAQGNILCSPKVEHFINIIPNEKVKDTDKLQNACKPIQTSFINFTNANSCTITRSSLDDCEFSFKCNTK